MPILPSGAFRTEISVRSEIEFNRNVADHMERLAKERGWKHVPESAAKLRQEADKLEEVLR